MTADEIARGLTECELRQVIRDMIGFEGENRVFAKDVATKCGVSKAYVSDVLNGRRGIADKLANALGYKRVVTFVPVHNYLKEQNNADV